MKNTASAGERTCGLSLGAATSRRRPSSSDGSVFVGGAFDTAGAMPSANVAQWLAPCCDYDGDGSVDVDDVVAIASLWSQPGTVPFDLDGDGWITVVDIQRVTRWWGAWVP